MAIHSKHKSRRRYLAALTLALSATLTLSTLAACAPADDTTEEEEETTTSQTDTQTIRNGNFEFYSEMDVEDKKDKLDLINSPDSWSFTSGSPTSDSASGIIDTTEWDYISRSGRELTSVEDAMAHWNDDEVTAYDRLKFLNDFEEEIDDLDADSDAAQFFDEYNYSIDYDDVQYLADISSAPTVHDGAAEGETSMLMIHNHRTDSSVVGTGQYYTSSTTITLDAGTAAMVSVWVRTVDLTHYYAAEEDGEPTAVAGNAGAYIRVNQTVGGTGSASAAPYPAYIENINTDGEWQQYTVYVRANSYATSTFTIVLGLGQGSSDDRLHYVNGFAFFDDLECTIMPSAAFDDATADAECNIDTTDTAKHFDASKPNAAVRSLKIDLEADFSNDPQGAISFSDDAVDITKDPDGGKSNIVYDGTYEYDYMQATTIGALATAADSNAYLRNIYNNDFADGYLFDESIDNDMTFIMLMSVSGAPYTAKSDNMDLGAGEHMIVSFWVKTSEIGGTGASATLVDGENRTQIEAFDSTAVATVDIDNPDTDEYNDEDIYNGWVRCFFFISNTTDSLKTFHLEFSYGPTDVASAEQTAYDDGYAAFTNFEVIEGVKKQYIDFASSGTYAQKVSLTGDVDNDSSFDTPGVVGDIATGLAAPHSFRGLPNASKYIVTGGVENELPEGLFTGLLNAGYAGAYRTAAASSADADAWARALNLISGDGAQATAEEWWADIFGDYNEDGTRASSRVANQPLVILNTSASDVPAYGFQSRKTFTVDADSYQRISMRVKLSADATATIYLLDASDVKTGYNDPLTPTLPSVTFWYDDSGNIVLGDPTASDFDARDDVLFYLEDNGLYTKAGADDGRYYANLKNYTVDETTNDLLAVDADGNTTIAFYYNAEDGKYYAYRTETSRGNYDYEQEVYDIYDSLTDAQKADTDYVRYNYLSVNGDPSRYESVITVEGTPENAGRWIEVTFYVHTGNTAKNYRLEVWAGSRDYVVNEENGEVTQGDSVIPAGGYVFFDDYTSTDVSENYTDLLSEAEDALKLQTGTATDANLDAEHALYYTYTFYDAKDYLRYDATTDEDNLGNPYGSYTQSSYSEGIAWMRYSNAADDTQSLFTTVFLDYSATDVTVTADDLSSDDDTTTDEGGDTTGDTNVWLIISSGILAFALVFAIVAIIVRRIRKKLGKHTKVKPAKDTRVRPKKDKATAPEEDTDETPAETPAEPPMDENDPYNE